MRLSKKFDYCLIATACILIGLLFVYLISGAPHRTFADSEASQIEKDSDSYFVTIYDGNNKTIAKTTPKTVAEVLEKLNIVVNPTDSVEPSLDTIVNANNFYINIYRSRPVIIKDGKIKKYIMASSYDPKTIAKNAGLTIYDGDEIELVYNDGFLENGAASVYKITRNGGRTITTEEELPFSEKTVKDFNLNPGEKEVRQTGEVGRKEIVYHVFYVDGEEVSRELVSETVIKEPVERIVAVGVSAIERKPLTPGMGRNYYTYEKSDGTKVERQETYYDLDMHKVMQNAMRFEGCNHSGNYSIREDGAKVDDDGYVLVAAHLDLYPRCSVVETSLGPGKVYDTGSFALQNAEQFDLATDWTNRNGN